MNQTAGTLYVVATPIGNLRDLSPRAQQILGEVQLIAAEDTRHTGQLLKVFGIATPLCSLHEHNEASRSQQLLNRLAVGESIALVSDAGTPLISDPGFDLVAAARTREIAVVPIPGACAAIAALSIAGLPTDRFSFEGFLAAKGGARRAQLEQLCSEQRTMVFYEAPHRLTEVLTDLAEIFGADRRAVVCRELTKQHESTYSGPLADLQQRSLHDPDMLRGEIVIVVAGNPLARSATSIEADRLLRELLEELSPSQAAKVAAKITGEKRADLYERAMSVRGRTADRGPRPE
jgi:16S rRNA (cytidine1402-2'-O)-methyltransferase